MGAPHFDRAASENEGRDMTILTYTTEDAHRRMEQCARDGGYQVREWLVPGHNGQGMRVAATMKVNGRTHGLGFKWGGEDINQLVERCIGLDLAMRQLPEAVAQGRNAFWEDH